MGNHINSLISIGIPLYNAEKYIEHAVVSVLNQTYGNFELIIVDDGSSDESVNIVRKFDDIRIKLIVDSKNRGLPYRLNQITSLARGEFIARMDADDIMHPERIEKQLKFMQENPEVDVSGSSVYIIDSKNNILGLRHVKLIKEDKVARIQGGVFIHPTVFGKASWFKQHSYDAKATRIEDVELWTRTSFCSKFQNLDIPLLFYREVNDNYHIKYKKAFSGKYYALKKVRQAGENKLFRFFLKLYLLNYIKYFSYSLLSMLGMEHILLNKRNERLKKGGILEKANNSLKEAIQISSTYLRPFGGARSDTIG